MSMTWLGAINLLDDDDDDDEIWFILVFVKYLVLVFI